MPLSSQDYDVTDAAAGYQENPVRLNYSVHSIFSSRFNQEFCNKLSK